MTETQLLAGGLLERYDITEARALELADTLVKAEYDRRYREYMRTRERAGRRA